MNPPLIGITTYVQKNKYGHPIFATMEKYVVAVQDAGGVAVLIPIFQDIKSIQKIINKIDGVLFTGGGDLAPRKNEEYTLSCHYFDIDEYRDSMEFLLLEKLISKKKPFLGICRGLQLINVALGGTLFTHLPEQFTSKIKHNCDSGTEREYLAHQVRVLTGTKLFQIIEHEEIVVNSLHHQGIEHLSSSLIPSATSPDGLIEGIELKDHPFGLAVQWHPEWLFGQPASTKIFKSFITAATIKKTTTHLLS